jgi:hypothetical protein
MVELKTDMKTSSTKKVKKSKPEKPDVPEVGMEVDENPKVVKGQLISECLFDFLKFSKKPTKNLTNFCPI